jgi:hypothetical protein
MEVRQVFSNIWVFKDWCFANAHWQRLTLFIHSERKSI